MTRGRVSGLLLAAVMLAVRPWGGVAANEAAPVRLIEVSSSAVGPSFEVLIEASAPAAYTTHQSDDRTVVVELRNVTADGAQMHVARGGPIADVVIEEAGGGQAGGRAVTRVRLELSRPLPYAVSSTRNTISVGFDASALDLVAAVPAAAPQVATTAAAAAKPPAAGARATRLWSLETVVERSADVVRLGADGILTPSSIHESEDAPPRLVIDLPEVESAVPRATPVGVGPLRQIRVAPHSHTPLITRVVFDLETVAPYRVEGIDHLSNELRVIFPLDAATAAPASPAVERVPSPDPGALAALAASVAHGSRPVTGPGGGVEPAGHVAANTILLDPLAALRVPARVSPAQDAGVTGLLAELASPAAREDSATDQPADSAARVISHIIAPAVTEAPPAEAERQQDAAPSDAATVPPQVRALDGPSPAAEPSAAAPAGLATPDRLSLLVEDEAVVAQLAEPLGPTDEPETIVAALPAAPSQVETFGAAPRAGEPSVAEPQRPTVSRTRLTLPARSPSAVGTPSAPRSPTAIPRPGLIAARRFAAEVVPATRFIRRGGAATRPRAGVTQQTLGGGRQYTGSPVSMDFQNADLRSVLRTFAEISGVNIVIDPQVQGSVDVALVDVPWDQALDIILRSNQLGYDVDGTVVRIAPLSTLADEEQQRRELAEQRALSGEVDLLIRTLSYARAADLADLITHAALSSRGAVRIDVRTNTLIITDLRDQLEVAEQLLDTLDRPEPQVEIEARIVALRCTSQALQLCVTEILGTTVDLGAPSRTSALGVTLGLVDDSSNLDSVLSAAEGEGQVEIVSNPRITTQNNVQAILIQGDQIPIQTVVNGTVTVQFKDAALRLAVTPQITAADTVIMQIEIDNDFADFGKAVNGIPPIVTQRAITTVQVANGDTTVIGGIYESDRQRRNDRVSGLSKIPLLGWLFKRETDVKDTDQLLIFLTPYIVR